MKGDITHAGVQVPRNSCRGERAATPHIGELQRVGNHTTHHVDSSPPSHAHVVYTVNATVQIL